MNFSAAAIERLAEVLSTSGVHRNRVPERDAATRVLVAIVAFRKSCGRGPWAYELHGHLGMSASSVYGCVRRLREAGLLCGSPRGTPRRPLEASSAGEAVVARLAGEDAAKRFAAP